MALLHCSFAGGASAPQEAAASASLKPRALVLGQGQVRKAG